MHEIYRMLGKEHDADLEREANRRRARALMSPKTVEANLARANLARVYRKLRIRSRAELGARIDGQTP